MQTTVYYEGWQMDCCGKPFAVGDIVEWNCNDYVDTDGLISTVEYIYEAHEVAKYEIKGKVNQIEAVTFEYKANGNIHYPISYTTQSIQKAEEFLAADFLVFLDNAQIKN